MCIRLGTIQAGASDSRNMCFVYPKTEPSVFFINDESEVRIYVHF
jgi:hypothetical protein